MNIQAGFMYLTYSDRYKEINVCAFNGIRVSVIRLRTCSESARNTIMGLWEQYHDMNSTFPGTFTGEYWSDCTLTACALGNIYKFYVRNRSLFLVEVYPVK